MIAAQSGIRKRRHFQSSAKQLCASGDFARSAFGVRCVSASLGRRVSYICARISCGAVMINALQSELGINVIASIIVSVLFLGRRLFLGEIQGAPSQVWQKS